MVDERGRGTAICADARSIRHNLVELTQPHFSRQLRFALPTVAHAEPAPGHSESCRTCLSSVVQTSSFITAANPPTTMIVRSAEAGSFRPTPAPSCPPSKLDPASTSAGSQAIGP